MFTTIKNWWRRRIIRNNPIESAEWQKVIAANPLLQQLPADELAKLKDLVTLFVYSKNFVAAEGFEYDLNKVLVIAAQACLPILHLGIDWYSSWDTIIVYPSSFATNREITDEHGVVHRVRDSMSGEAWQDGPVILSWPETESAGEIDGENLVIHEFAHKLDMLNGAANGMPPLHSFMSRELWTKAFSEAFSDMQARLDNHEETEIDPYAATDPAEFFAVISEVYFEQPGVLNSYYPEVYSCLRQFYQKNP